MKAFISVPFPIIKPTTAPVMVLLLTVLFASTVQADRLHFTDGESITGALVSIEDGKINWRSAILGDLTVQQHHIEWIETGDRFDLKISGKELNNCWMYLQRNRQLLHCDEGVQTLSSWKLVIAAGETLTEPPPLLAQAGSLIVAAEDSSGNNNITKYNVHARSEIRFIESRHTLALRYEEESVDSETTRNAWLTSYQYDQFFTEQWFATGNAFYQEDEFRELDQRTSAGLGMGYQFLDTAYVNLLAKGTFNYIDERFTTGQKRTTPGFLWNLNFGWRFNEQGMEFFHRHALLQGFDSGEDFELTSTTGFKYPIGGRFSSVVQLEYDYDNLPAESAVDKKDQKWSIGVNYDW
ncbi:MAG: DUF481 domain-containing protein [Halieaceae bacterium]